ncbi:MAG: winged helix-turn-helix transcriptional regulator, partial [Promethearchaeota archaeon]
YALLKNHNQLDPLVSFIRQNGEIDELEVGLVSFAPSPNAPLILNETQSSNLDTLEEMSPTALPDLDYLIIDALKDNSRKPISDIADEVGTSTKTVRRHLESLIKNNLVEFTIDWYPDKAAVTISIIILKINPSTKVDKSKLVTELHQNFGQTIIFSWNLSNLPNLIPVCIWTQSMKELQNIEAKLLSMNLDSVNVTVLINGMMFPTWREAYLEEKVKSIKKK